MWRHAVCRDLVPAPPLDGWNRYLHTLGDGRADKRWLAGDGSSGRGGARAGGRGRCAERGRHTNGMGEQRRAVYKDVVIFPSLFAAA